MSFWGKYAKNHKLLGRDLKNSFLPNKKYVSVVSDGNRNFLEGEPENLYLKSPLPRDLVSHKNLLITIKIVLSGGY